MTSRPRPRSIGVDWSGAVYQPEKKIWLCEVQAGEVRRIEAGRTREQVADHLIELAAQRGSELCVGLDFAFSFPAGFLTKRAHRGVASVWSEAEALGERWLEHCPFPFWGKPGSRKPPLGERLHRVTELDIARETGFQPFSVFQIGGAGELTPVGRIVSAGVGHHQRGQGTRAVRVECHGSGNVGGV